MVNVKNVYYMLSYAYQDLRHIGYSNIGVEEFDNIHNLLSAILSKGITAQLKQGLTHDYEDVEEELSSPKGKLQLTSSVKERALNRRRIICNYQVYSDNNIFNQILKCTVLVLLRSRKVDDKNKKTLKRLLLYFNEVNIIERQSINWNTLGYKKNSKSYRLLMNLCYLVLNGLILTTTEGKFFLAEYLDDRQMYRLYEKFVLCYYQKEYPELHAKAAYIDWNADDNYIEFLPQMKSDITLAYNHNKLIIDTKYYNKAMSKSMYGSKETIISSNMYQIFTYVKNADHDTGGIVQGLLLYAKTDEEIVPNNTYHLSGNTIFVKSLDLNTDWDCITGQLNEIADTFMKL